MYLERERLLMQGMVPVTGSFITVRGCQDAP